MFFDLLYEQRYRAVLVVGNGNDEHAFARGLVGALGVGVEDQVVPSVKTAEGVVVSGVMPDFVVLQNGILR